MKFVRDLNQIDKEDILIAGGKAASLGEMLQNDILVPSGFVILSSTFEKFLKYNNLEVEIKEILNSIKYESDISIKKASNKIRSIILKSIIPNDIKDEVISSFKKLKSEFVAVRSSATAEDGITNAWAGQLDTFLNSNEYNLLENIKKCWASLYTSRAITYCAQKKMNKQNISVAVIVQEMIQSEVSGVCFTIHPVTASKDEMIIEAGYGLGEAIVGGLITPDTYVIKKSDEIKLISKNISSQSKMIVRSQNKNITKVVSTLNKNKQKLSDKQIIELTKLCLEIEKHYGKPQDIEWAIMKGKIYILQSRPITTLKSVNNSDTLLEYIKSQKWFIGMKAKESLMFYSAKIDGQKKHVKREHSVDFAESIFIASNIEYPIRVMNQDNISFFHEISERKILKTPNILEKFIQKDAKLWDNIADLTEELMKMTSKKDEEKSIRIFKRIFELYEKVMAYFIIIFSLGMKLTQNKEKLSNVDDILKQHDYWRNNIASKEEKMGEGVYFFLKSLITANDSKITPLDMMEYLSLKEIISLLNKKIKFKAIEDIIKLRIKHGFIYLNLDTINQDIIDNPAQISKIKNYFLALEKLEKESGNSELIPGQVTFSIDKKIKGSVIVIKDKSQLEQKGKKLRNKILVAIQTTPQYISYLADVKAIVTDEGGITCHAAIISRELKKPCLIGTKVATERLKDGDVVEIDFNIGTLKILNHNNKN